MALLASPTVAHGSPYVADLEILAHEKVEGGAGVHADGADAAAAVPQEPQAEVGAQLRVFLEQQLRELSYPKAKIESSQAAAHRNRARGGFCVWGPPSLAERSWL